MQTQELCAPVIAGVLGLPGVMQRQFPITATAKVASLVLLSKTKTEMDAVTKSPAES